MSFYIFAAGTGGYTYTRRRHADEGDAYDLGDALNRVQSLSGGVGGFVEDEAVGAASGPNPLQLALNTVGSYACVGALETAFQLALVHAGGRMTINLAATEQHSFLSFPTWPDTGGAVNYQAYSSDQNAFRDFLRAIHPALEAAGLNRFRVLCIMAGIIADWDTGGSIAPRRGIPMLNFQIQAD